MFYIGLDNIEEHIEKDYYSRELEDVPYAFGQHDVVALLGKVNNLERNVITLVIGEDENYKNILAANYDGQLGADGEYEGDYHHIGYDVEATKIYNKLIEYEQDKVWKKAYWIVGYGTGGSIANLVAKKIIDLKENREPVFCYTYQAPGTINRNNLDKRIYNVKYHSIFNVINSSDYMMQLDDMAKFARYGKIKQADVGFSKKSDNSLIYAFNETNGIGSILRELGLSIYNNKELKDLIKTSYLFIDNMSVNPGNFALTAYKDVSSKVANKINVLSKPARSIDKIDEVATKNVSVTGGDEILSDNIYSWNIREFLNSLFEWCEYFKGCGYESGKKPITLEGKYNIKNFGKIDVDKGDSLTDDDKEKIKFDCSGFVAGMYALASEDMRANNNSFVNPAEDKLYFRYFYKKNKDGNEIKSESPTAVWRKYNQNYDKAHIDTKFSYAGTANQVAACKDNAIWVYNKDDTKDESIISSAQCKDTSKDNSISFKKYVEHYNEIYKKKYDKDPDTLLLSSDDDYNKIIKPGDLLFVTESPGHIAIVKREVAEYNYDSKTYNNYTLEVWHSGTWDNVTKDENDGKYEGVINSLFTGGAKDVADLYIEEIKENGDLVTSVPVYRYKTIAGNKTYYNNAYIFRVLNWEE